MRVFTFLGSTASFLFYKIFLSSDPPPLMVNITTNGSIIDVFNLPCEQVYSGNKSAIKEMKLVELDLSPLHKFLMESDNSTCGLIRTALGFDKSSATDEERDFPLAYAVLAHDKPEQLLLMLAAFYEEHNLHCLAFPSNADEDHKTIIRSVAECFPNIHVMEVLLPVVLPIEWGSPEILRANYKCMELLVNKRSQVQWKYVQFLSGVDVPLRTNLEMVRILKQWNGLSHTHVTHYKEELIGGQEGKPRPLPLFKSSLAAIVSYEAAKMLAEDRKARDLLDFLSDTIVSDESFWSSAFGNPDVLPIPGAFNASAYMEHKDLAKATDFHDFAAPLCSHPPCIKAGFVGRFQTWKEDGECNGYWKSSSCVYGVGDLPAFRESAAFIAHKVYIDFKPAAFICALKEAKRHREQSDKRFDAEQYTTIPQIEFARGVPYENLTRPDLLGSS